MVRKIYDDSVMPKEENPSVADRTVFITLSGAENELCGDAFGPMGNFKLSVLKERLHEVGLTISSVPSLKIVQDSKENYEWKQ